MANIYELSEKYADAIRMLNEAESEEEYMQAEEIFFEAGGDLAEKIENRAKYRANLMADVKAYKEEERRLAEKRRSLERKLEHLDQVTKQTMENFGIERSEGELFTTSIQSNSQPTINILDESMIPEEFFVPQPDKIDKTKLRDHFKATGEVVPGIKIERGTHLRVR